MSFKHPLAASGSYGVRLIRGKRRRIDLEIYDPQGYWIIRIDHLPELAQNATRQPYSQSAFQIGRMCALRVLLCYKKTKNKINFIKQYNINNTRPHTALYSHPQVHPPLIRFSLTGLLVECVRLISQNESALVAGNKPLMQTLPNRFFGEFLHFVSDYFIYKYKFLVKDSCVPPTPLVQFFYIGATAAYNCIFNSMAQE